MSGHAQVSLSRLEEIAGGAHVDTGAEAAAAHEVCAARPSVVISPENAEQIGGILRFAAGEKLAVIPAGGRTKLGIGSPPARYDIALDLSRMNRVLAYDPHDLTLGVEPGVRIADLLATLAEKKQFLPLAVAFADRATVGGIVAANSSSPLRYAAGAVRDFCLGMEFVTGEGKQAKSGGRVVKNVTGYDLHKALIGSLGTLAVITRVNFRTFPAPPAQGMFIASFSSSEGSFEYCRAISHSVLMPQMVEVADPGAARFVFSGKAAKWVAPAEWRVVVSAAGPPAVVDRSSRELGRMASAYKAVDFVSVRDAEESAIFTGLCEFPRLVLEAAPGAAIFRISVLPTATPALLNELSEIAKRHGIALATLTRASGIVYAAFLPQEVGRIIPNPLPGTVAEVFRACNQPETQASAMLEWCPTELKTSPDAVWGPSRPDFALMRRVKNSFDPQGVLAPGRFAGGI